MIKRIWHSEARKRLQGKALVCLGRQIDYFTKQYRNIECQRIVKNLGKCGEGVRIVSPAVIVAPEKIQVGHNVHIQENSFIRAEAGLKIGDNTHISRNLVLYTANHNYKGERLPYDETFMNKPVEIGRNVWIGMNVCIAPGTIIGDGAIVGMGTVVSGIVPPLAIIGAAKWNLLKYRDKDHYAGLDEKGRYGGIGGYPIEVGTR